MKERLHYVHDGPINGIPKIGQIRQEGKWDEMANGTKQSIARCIFNSRDEIENFFLSVSCFETRSRISACQSHASRRDREFLPFSLMLRDEIENFCLSVSCFETRSRSSWEFLEILPDETVVFAWSCWLHGQLSSIDINCQNLKHKIVFFCFEFCKNFTF